jgi:seryl-tRNA synthetase
MIDIKHLVENPNIYALELQKRGKDDTLAYKTKDAYELWKTKQQELEVMRQKKNDFNTKIVSLSPLEKVRSIGEMKHVSEQIRGLESEARELKENFDSFLAFVPNLTWDGIPVGPDDSANEETGVFGKGCKFDFEPQNYYDLPVFKRDYLGEKGVEASGFRGFYIRGEMAKLQQVLFSWTMDRLIAKGFEFVIPPIFVNEEVLTGTGFFPTGREDVYEVKDGEKVRFLPGTSEAALMFLHTDETLDLSSPKKLTAWTRCFRKEAGAYGKDTKGGIRVTQFEKIETVYLCDPRDSLRLFEEMKDVFVETADLLGLYYHTLEVSTGDISLKNHRQVDIEAWFPAQNAFRELCSASHCTDYQTRTLGIKSNVDGIPVIAHSLNCTGMVNRVLFAIMEQFQQSDGRIKIPSVLAEKFGKEYLE